MYRVVVTGMGAVTPIGNNVEEFNAGLKEGKNGIDKISTFDTSDFKAVLAGEIKGLDVPEAVGKKEARRMDRFTQLAILASEEAWKDSGIIEGQYDPFDVSVYVSSGIGGLSTMEENVKKFIEKGPGRVSPFFIPMNIINMAAGEVSIRLKAMGSSFSTVSACASGTHAIGEAFRSIKHGYSKVAVTGGTEASITPMAIAGFANMKALNETDDRTKGSIPFDKDRKGFVMGEGAGVIVLEELESAVRRGARIYAEIVGYGSTSDAYHITAPHPEGLGGYMAMRKAVEEAGITPDKVDYINAHGTSTPMNDQLESKAISRLFGNEVKVSSTKSMTGHLLGAAGGVEAIASVLSIRDSFIPPTINTENIDEVISVNVVYGKMQEAKVSYALSNSLGFGGHNASILFKEWEGK